MTAPCRSFNGEDRAFVVLHSFPFQIDDLDHRRYGGIGVLLVSKIGRLTSARTLQS